MATYKKAMNRLDSYTPLGYSLCGVVVEVGAGAEEFAVGRPGRGGGQRVRAARRGQLGARPTCASRSPRSPPPARGVRDGGRDRDAGRPPRGAAARASSPASSGSGSSVSSSSGSSWLPGVRVVGLDTVAARCGWPRTRARWSARPRTPKAWRWWRRSLRERVRTDWASTTCSSPPAAAPTSPSRSRRGWRATGPRSWTSARRRLDLPWNAYYEKELDVRFSRSYGPGRYDDRYELDGIDYPAGYVRWTERRNLGCFLDLLATGQLSLDPWCRACIPSPRRPGSTTS